MPRRRAPRLLPLLSRMPAPLPPDRAVCFRWLPRLPGRREAEGAVLVSCDEFYHLRLPIAFPSCIAALASDLIAVRRTMMKRISACLFILAALPMILAQNHTVTPEQYERWKKELSNWGRWGKEDQLGAINLITPAKRKQAAALVTEGVSVSLARDTEKEKAVDNPNPFAHEMIWTGSNSPTPYSLDAYSVTYHGFAHTHMDALCHMFYQGKMFNGFSQKEVTDKGANKLAIAHLKGGIFTRGILMDIPKLKGVPYLEPGTPIY